MPRVPFSRTAWAVCLISAAHQMLMLASVMILARLMSVSDFGLLSIVMAILTIVAIPFRGGFPLYVTQYIASREITGTAGLINRWRWLIPLMAFIAGGLVAGVFAVTSDQAAPLLKLAPFYLASVGVVMMAGAVQRGFFRIARGRVTELLIQPVMLIALLLFFLCRHQALGAYDAMAVQTTAVFAAALIAIFITRRALPDSLKNVAPSYHDSQWLREAAPMMIGIALITINAAIDVVMVGYLLDEAAAGPYRLAAQLATLLTFFLAVSNNMTQPMIAKLYAEDDQEGLQKLLTRAAQGTFALSILPAALMIIFPAFILTVFFGAPYAIAASALMVLALTALFNVATGQSAQLLLIIGHGREVSIVAALSLAINVVLNLILVPHMGLIGAACASAISVLLWKGWLTCRAYQLTGLNTSLWPCVRNNSHVSRETMNDVSERSTPIQP